ncbi:MAG: hypothetical protein P1V97_23650 [Planctomycetota bacterium]|nr:hypothetical protein [Planctomycetota bacterium]
MADELVFNTCLEDVEYFIERFERRATNPGGDRFAAPLDRLRQLRERLQHLRDLERSKDESPGSTATLLTPPVINPSTGDLEDKLSKLQESVEQRFSRLNLTVSSILENLTSIPRNLEIGLQSIDKALQNIDAQVLKVQKEAAEDREQWKSAQEDMKGLHKKLESMSSTGEQDELLGGVDDLTNDMIELRNRLKSLEEKLSFSESNSRVRLEKQTELIEEVAQGTDSMQVVFQGFLKAVKSIQWPSTSGTMMIPSGIPVVTPLSSTVAPPADESSLTDTLNLNTGGGFIPPGSRPSTTRFPVLKEPMEFVGDEEDFSDVGETIQMSAAETAQLVASVKDGDEDDDDREDGSATLVTPMRFLGTSEDTTAGKDGEASGGEFKFNLDDVDI